MPADPRTELSTRDSEVLSLLFDPEAQPVLRNDSKTSEQPNSFYLLSVAQVAEVRSAERKAVELAEKGSLIEAEDTLSCAIAKYPKGRPSLWSNRAQVRRLRGNFDAAIADLSEAIRLATPPKHGVATVEDTKTLSSAHTHRATIYLLAARGGVPGALGDRSPDELEEKASHDFGMAGKYGNELSRAMAVRTNPYAKMCGSIVQTALSRELRSFPEI
jgi:tetratricopeptide (TPR) repeat protein